MSGLNQIGLWLTIIFVIFVVAVLAELCYVLWRRRFFHRQGPRQAVIQGRLSADSSSQAFSDASSTCIPFSCNSKELLYFYFCMSNSRISRVQPDSAPPSLDSDQSCPDEDMEEVIDVFKLQNMYGPPRFLFTIKEEEKENDGEYFPDKDKSDENCRSDGKRSVKLGECFKCADDEEEYSSTLTAVLPVTDDESVGNEHAIVRDGQCDTATTPFSTPCESPSYHTPAASPTHQLQITIVPSET